MLRFIKLEVVLKKNLFARLGQVDLPVTLPTISAYLPVAWERVSV